MPFLVVDVCWRKESSIDHNMYRKETHVNLYLNARRQYNPTKNSQCCSQWQTGPKPSATFAFQSTFRNNWYSPKEFQRVLNPQHHTNYRGTATRQQPTCCSSTHLQPHQQGAITTQPHTTTENLRTATTHQTRLRPQISKHTQQTLRVWQSVHWSNR